ncbi:MAG TPA: M24 family metallopeptidase [Solirubrobacteraceae bacterium]|nr:M24 family metallopeptidase [Solirubrobacteraceae bacterium]
MDVLIYADTERSAALRHELPLDIGDPFLYLETGGRRAVLTGVLEADRIAEVAPDVEILDIENFGLVELLRAGHPRVWIERELCLRAATALGVSEAAVPGEFPLALADHLRASGIALRPDDEHFFARRRSKNAAELAGIRRAADVAVAAMREAARMLREAEISGERLVTEGREELTAESVRARIREVCANAGAPVPEGTIVRAALPGAAFGHDPGHGPLFANAPVHIDLWPRDERSGCFADMTRIFVRGHVSDSYAQLQSLVLAAHEEVCAAVAPDVVCGDLYGLVCDRFEAAGHATRRTHEGEEPLREGFLFALGHGVGLEVHEEPIVSLSVSEKLVEGDVIAIEPGLISPSVGGAGVEDTLLVTSGGSERLTGKLGYDLHP